MSSPRSRNEFFPYVIHIIYAAIIAYSFQVIEKHLIPFTLINTLPLQINFLGIVFVWGVMISGWLGYTKSINDKMHSENIWGSLRFCFDLVITFFMFYLVSLTRDVIFVTDFGSIFVWVLPAIFVLFIIWDLIKRQEYQDDDPDNILEKRALITIFAAMAIGGQVIFFYLYNSIVSFLVSSDLASDVFWKYLVFMTISALIIGLYRKVKSDLPLKATETS